MPITQDRMLAVIDAGEGYEQALKSLDQDINLYRLVITELQQDEYKKDEPDYKALYYLALEQFDKIKDQIWFYQKQNDVGHNVLGYERQHYQVRSSSNLASKRYRQRKAEQKQRG